MEGNSDPIEPQRNVEIMSEEILDISPDSSVRYGVLSINSDFTTSFGLNSTWKGTQFDKELTAASADHMQMLVQKRLSDLPGEPHKNQPITIYRVPASLREKRKALYEPRMVSIGPYYHGREELRAMEEHKWWCLRDFMSRKPEISLDIYLQEIRKLEFQARQSYSESIKLGSNEFVLMLLLDGCFILEYFLKYEDKKIDIHCDVGWGGPTIISDLFLLENQIPFFIIHKLASSFSDLKDCQSCENCCNLVYNLSSLLPYKEMLTHPDVSCNNIQHLLHLYYICMVPKSQTAHLHTAVMKRSPSWLWMRVPQEASEGKASQNSVIIPCAAELHYSGVKFKRSSSHHLFDITFNKGVMEMPLLVFDNIIRTIFTNIVAFEQSQINKTRIFTSYVVLLNMLVDTARDVSLLEQCSILELVQHNEEQAADFFNELADCWSMDYDDHYYANLFLDLQKFSSSKIKMA
ncbi:hypothetical protein LUZ61_012884 [Rhynchospora tenuis]|uniref:Uncharacterized protein n=1 Tax=Rhynchospora tenuis TaxID=198213 RepID=A0AAD6A4A3_9POAL|nr:hypothetical protein LUZ61_012883 [Rhynchospora tenuis]KAJ3709179.1 hypothetical protein LUZ61_012884 [Rhynchospora tenuis]